ncbi:hypothetical protein LP419_14250 [Massilia sp. H-1]|nr:hypothetical protein LP419_14250 [Massilia sp. H-1]
MRAPTSVVNTFPSARIDSQSGGLAVEVSLIAQLMHGSGNHLFASVAARQEAHQEFVDELDEPSAKLGGTDFDKGDPTSLYSFVVGPRGHPFHRHAGHRVFTAVSGSGGAQLRFSSASVEQIEEDPHNFIRALQFINIPPDCMFTVRFGGETWHQFAPLTENSVHPVFFALSCHTNELGGAARGAAPESHGQRGDHSLTDHTAAANGAGPAGTHAAPDPRVDHRPVARCAARHHAARRMQHRARERGVVLGAWGRWRGSRGYVSNQASRSRVLN